MHAKLPNAARGQSANYPTEPSASRAVASHGSNLLPSRLRHPRQPGPASIRDPVYLRGSNRRGCPSGLGQRLVTALPKLQQTP